MDFRDGQPGSARRPTTTPLWFSAGFLCLLGMVGMGVIVTPGVPVYIALISTLVLALIVLGFVNG